MNIGYLYLRKQTDGNGNAIAYCFGLTSNKKRRWKTYRKENLQGTWGRPNVSQWFKIEGNNIKTWFSNRPGHIHERGVVRYPSDSNHAVVNFGSGYAWWIYSAGEGVSAIEAFTNTGKMARSEVYYIQAESPALQTNN